MKKFALVLILMAFFGSCDKPQDDELESTINGKWSLKTAHVQVYYGDNDLSGNKIIFDISIKSATFVGEEFIRESGKYGYTYRDGLLSFGTDRFYRYQLNGDQLILTYADEVDVIDDEAAFIYQRDLDSTP